MNSLPEQFSAARQAQLDNGFNLMRSLGDQAFDRTSRVFALQLDASRAAVEQSSNAMRQLLAANDPRDLLALGSQSQQHLRTMLDYGRELFSIATAGMSVPVLGHPPLAFAPLPSAPAAERAAEQAASEAFERIGGDTASAAAAAAESVAEQIAQAVAEPQAEVQAEPQAEVQAEPQAQVQAEPQAQVQAEVQAGSNAEFAQPAVAQSDENVLSVVTSDITPDSAPTAIAKATSEALDTLGTPPHPVAASLPVEVAVEIELPKVEPVDATPPPAAVTGRPAETRGTKGRRKQS